MLRKTGLLFFTFSLFFSAIVFSQKKTAIVKGKVVDEDEKPLSNVTVYVLNASAKTITNDTGYFSIEVAAGKPLALTFTYTGFNDVQKNFFLSSNETDFIVVRMQHAVKELQNVTVTDDRDRRQTGLVNIDASRALVNPSPITGVESLIKFIVGSNNELTSQYS